jgi:Putative peptidoglycan binding domain
VVSQLRGDEPRLELGDSGEGVQELQFRLYRLGYYRQFPDGTYDMATENAVRELQSSLGHDNTGEMTRESWEGIVYWEQQHGLDYEYHSPSDALAQLRYDLEHPQPAADPNLSPDGHWRWDGHDWVAAADPNLSSDGHWRWDGHDWVATAAAPHEAHSAADGYVGQLSPDRYWRWNGADWEVA